MWELVDEEAPTKARIIKFVNDNGPTWNYKLTREFDLSPSSVAKAVQTLKGLGVLDVEGEPQEGKGGKRIKKLIKMNPDMVVRIATQPIPLPAQVIRYSVAWDRRAPGSYYSKHLACYLRKDEPTTPRFDY
jgi:hypothetical protein